MKRFFFLFFLLPFISLAQSHIELRNTFNGNIATISDNSRVKVVANGHTYRGKLHIVDGQSFYVKKALVSLNDVTEISSNSTIKAVAGTASKTAGLLTGGTTLDKSQKHHSRSDWAYRIVL